MTDDKKDDRSIFNLVEGFSDVDPKDLNEFIKTMENKTIPAIVEIVEKRRLSAAESRHKQLRY